MTEAGSGSISIHVNVPSASEGQDEVPDSLIREGVVLALQDEGVEEGELSLTFVDDATIQELNRTHLGHDRPTDVLAFALHAEGDPPLGDIYIGLEQAHRQAEERGLSPGEELLRLAIHGTLHVLGYDHPEGEGREESTLFRRQESLISRILR